MRDQKNSRILKIAALTLSIGLTTQAHSQSPGFQIGQYVKTPDGMCIMYDATNPYNHITVTPDLDTPPRDASGPPVPVVTINGENTILILDENMMTATTSHKNMDWNDENQSRITEPQTASAQTAISWCKGLQVNQQSLVPPPPPQGSEAFIQSQHPPE